MSINKILYDKRVWIYGIGVTGKRICQIFKYFNIRIEGILVSNAKGNIDRYMNINVQEFSMCDFNSNDVIIVTASGRAKDEIVKTIILRNVQYIVWTSELLGTLWKNCDYSFVNRIKGAKKVCLVLSGYKEYLWEKVYKRLGKYVPEDVEICLCSAGKCVDVLNEIARINNWSYLSTNINSVSLIQNIGISLYENAEWIFKMDEDMFVTNGTFERMLNSAYGIIKSGIYEFGVCSPLIPVNGVGYRYVLEKYKKLELFEEIFGKAIIGGNPQREIEKNPDAAKFMWGAGGIPSIDQMANETQEKYEYQICNTRLSIGFVLFQRKLWEAMQGFVVYGNMDLRVDEEDINAYCINNSKVMVISMNAVVGHFGFGKQVNKMKEYYIKNQDRF